MNDNRGERSDGQGPFGDVKTGCNLLIFVARVVGAPFEVWLRKPGTCGESHMGMVAALGWLALLMVPALMFPQEPQGPVLFAWVCTTALFLVNRVEGVRRRRRGEGTHSRYTGDSVFTPTLTDSQTKAKTLYEPVALGLAGAVLLTASLPLAIYTLAGAVCLSLTAACQEQADLARQRAIRDARFEAYQMSHDQRGGH